LIILKKYEQGVGEQLPRRVIPRAGCHAAVYCDIQKPASSKL